jgi:hypothetical protein
MMTDGPKAGSEKPSRVPEEVQGSNLSIESIQNSGSEEALEQMEDIQKQTMKELADAKKEMEMTMKEKE